MCIVTLSFCGFALDYQDVKFRIAGNLTLLLTSVAFKLSVNQHLPMIPYLTGLVSQGKINYNNNIKLFSS